jgi:hypothetical protein
LIIQEKTKKVLEIWSKAGTFAPTVITRLMNRVEGTSGADQGIYHVSVTLLVRCVLRSPENAGIPCIFFFMSHVYQKQMLNSIRSVSLEPDVAALNSPPHSNEPTPHPEAKATPAMAAEDTQATLRALLSQAASAVGGEG